MGEWVGRGGEGRGMKPGINVDYVTVDLLLLIDICLQESQVQQHYQPVSGHVHRNNSLDAFVRPNRTLPNISSNRSVRPVLIKMADPTSLF